MVKVSAPGTCGEYLQGIFDNKPSLISSPIDLFSTTTITRGTGRHNLRDKGRKALELFFLRTGLGPELGDTVDIETVSELPEKKGMASSTADIVSLLGALSSYFKVPLSQEETADICVSIEPSDNLMYKNLNLFNHYTGEVYEELGASFSAPVLIIDFDFEVDTVGFGYETEFKKEEGPYLKALALFKEGLKEKDAAKIGRACTISAENNQSALLHPYFETVKKLTERYGGLGNLIGHSGSVIGVLYDENFELEDFTRDLKGELSDHIGFIKKQHLIPGGIRVRTT